MRKECLQNLTLTGYIKSKKDKGKAVTHLPDKFVWMDDGMSGRSASKGRKSAKEHYEFWRSMIAHVLKWCDT